MTKGDDGKGKLEENNALMANGRAKPPEKTSFSTFIYNKRDGSFLGRTAKSWGQIIVFYIIFYICLAAFWLACLAVFLSTIDPAVPRYYGKNTIIGANPGVGYQPWLKEDPESTLIRFNTEDESSYSKYVKVLKEYMDYYTKTSNLTRPCAGLGESNAQYVIDGKVNISGAKPCRFDKSAISKACNDDNKYGFGEGKPCVVLSLNRLIGWIPEPFEGDDKPAVLGSRYSPNAIAFNCEGISESDKEVIGTIDYIPKSGIDKKYYPYAMMDGYQQPFAVVKFTNLPVNRIVMVKCAAYAKNIEQDEDSRAGMVTFELLKQSIKQNITKGT